MTWIKIVLTYPALLTTVELSSKIIHDRVLPDKAVDILSECEWDDDDSISEFVDGAVPIYTGELMEIYASNSSAVDEAVEEMGQQGDSSKNASIAWYIQIERMVSAIKSELEELIEE